MSRKRKHRIRSPHPGVVLYQRKVSGKRGGWYAREVDPKTEKYIYRSLGSFNFPDDDAMKDWAIARSQAIAAERAALAASGGVLRREFPTVPKAVKDYKDRHKPELRERTQKSYAASLAILEAWAEQAGIGTTAHLNREALSRFRAHVIGLAARKPLAGGKRGAREEEKRHRGAFTTNRDLRQVRMFLNDLRRVEALPRLDSDAIRDSLKGVKLPRPVPTYLRVPEIRRLLEAALRHDREKYRMTRPEHDGKRKPGTTSRYSPIAPFVAAVLLTGGRFDEIASLKWAEVDLGAKEIVLSPERVKTSHGRRIPLDVTPGLAALLAKMKLRAGEEPFVFRGKTALSRNEAKSAQVRLRRFGAPVFSWQGLRRTAGTYLTCAPGVYGSASVFMSARRLGHSVLVAERCYLGAVNDIPPDARTLEAACGIEALVARIAAAVAGDATEKQQSRKGKTA